VSAEISKNQKAVINPVSNTKFRREITNSGLNAILGFVGCQEDQVIEATYKINGDEITFTVPGGNDRKAKVEELSDNALTLKDLASEAVGNFKRVNDEKMNAWIADGRRRGELRPAAIVPPPVMPPVKKLDGDKRP